MSLIVVHADEGVCGFSSFGEEGGVGRDWAFDANAFGLGCLDGGQDDLFFLTISEETVFTGVRVESEHAEERIFAADLRHGIGGEANDLENPWRRERARNLGEADVDGDEACADFLGILHHAGGWRVAAGRKYFGVTGEPVSCGMEGFLAEWGGGDGVKFPVESIGQCGADVVESGVARCSRDDSGFETG